MSEELGNQIQTMFKTIYESVDLRYMRVIKRHMFKCGYDCLDEKNSAKQAEQCVDSCGQTMHHAMTILQTEANAFQGRIDRCLMNCQDDVRNEKDETKARKSFDACAEKCVVQFTPVVSEVVKVLSEKLEKLKKDNKIK